MVNPHPDGDRDAELLEELQRVGSDLGFRNWTRRNFKFLIALIVFDLCISGLAIFSVIAIRNVQHEACDRDNLLRKAYVDQWSPIIADSPVQDPPPDNAPQDVKDAYEANMKARNIFIASLTNGFAQHSC